MAEFKVAVSADNTPFANAPMYVGSTPYMSDENGEFVARVGRDEDASISSRLKALKVEEINQEQRETLTGTGAELALIASNNNGVISVSVRSRIDIAPLCLAYSQETGAEMLWFRYTNRSGEALEVPNEELNRLFSPQGQPFPISSFTSTDETQPDFLLGFEWSPDYFKVFDPVRNQEVIQVRWILLGREVSLDQPLNEVPLCATSGQFEQCAKYPEVMSTRVIQQAVSTVSRMSKAAEKAKKRGLWNPQGTFRKRYFKQMAGAIAGMRKTIKLLPRVTYVCGEAPPPGCSSVTYPKAELQGHFQNMFRLKFPPGLKHLAKMYPAEHRKFILELSRQPDQLVSCSR